MMSQWPAAAVVAITLVLTTTIRSATAVKCYDCSYPLGNCSQTCEGAICVNATTMLEEMGTTIVLRFCENNATLLQGCHDVNISAHAIRACFCNTNLCNSPPSEPPESTQEPLLECYKCKSSVNDCSNPSKCLGSSCLYAEGNSSSGVHTIERQCDYRQRLNESFEMKVDGVLLTVSTCTKNLCNNKGVIMEHESSESNGTVGVI